MAAAITVYHDTRHEKKNNSFPVKIRIYDGRSTRLYSTGVDLTENDFLKITTTKNLKGQLLKHKNSIEDKRLKATAIIEKMANFSHAEFRKKFKRSANNHMDVFCYYKLKICELQELHQIKTSIVYLHASDSFRRFLQPKPTKLSPERSTNDLREDSNLILRFSEVDVKWLNKYEKWMIEKQNSLTTVSMYLRTLRTIFNEAIGEKEIDVDLYPFGKNCYIIPSGAARKYTFAKVDLQKVLRTIWNFKTKDELIIKARDFWFFIYNAYGMNVSDIVLLEATNIVRNKIFFVRKKTRNTTKRETIIEVPINTHMRFVIEKYGQLKKGYVFQVLNPDMNEVEKVAATDAFTTFINDHMERLCKLAEVTLSCTTYTARHLFGTMAIRNGASTALVQKAFGHQSIITTENYIGDFDSEAKRKVSEGLMNF